MAGYGSAASMHDLLSAMKEQALQSTTKLRYLKDVFVGLMTDEGMPSEPTIYLVPTGSPEDILGESGAAKVVRARHQVNINCVTVTSSPFTDDLFLGSGKEIGILKFVEDVLDFYRANTLSLTTIDQQNKPSIMVAESGYTVFEEGDALALVAQLKYEALTTPFAS